MKILKSIFSLSVLASLLVVDAYALSTDEMGNITLEAENPTGLFLDSIADITIKSDASLVAEDYVRAAGDIIVTGGFKFDQYLADYVVDGDFLSTGSMGFGTNDSEISAKQIKVTEGFVIGGAGLYGAGGANEDTWNLTLNVDKINVDGDFTVNDTAKLTVNPTMDVDGKYLGEPSLTAGNVNIDGGLYMGGAGGATDVVHIVSDASDNVYKIITGGDFSANNVNAETGTLDITAGTVNVANDMQGDINIDTGSLTLGGASLDLGQADWRDRLQHTQDGLNADGSQNFVGDLLTTGTIKSTGDILIGGRVDDATAGPDGGLAIIGDADMWVGEDLLGYWSIDVKNLYVLGDVNGSGNISADTINVGGDLSGDINIDTKDLTVKNVLGGTKFRPNQPNGSLFDDMGHFHVNPDNPDDPFKYFNMTVTGIYEFTDDSYLQLVLNSTNESDDALITVGGFDAGGMTKSPNLSDMDSTPNVEILVDNLIDPFNIASSPISTINLIKVVGTADNPMPDPILDLGMLDFAGVWFYWDADGDGINDARLFQEARLGVDDSDPLGHIVYAELAMMDSIEKLTSMSSAATKNDRSVAGAVDDLIYHRLYQYTAGNVQDLDKYYTAIMRILFPDSDVYYDLMLNGGSHTDALDAMVSGNPDYAVDFVRGIGLGNISDVGNKLALSARISRNAVADQLTEDFIWTRYYDKNVAWARMGFGDDVTSFNFGADTKLNKKSIVGFNLGYNSIDMGALDGYTFNLGLYGTYELNKWARMYANMNFAYHSADVQNDNLIVGQMKSDLSTADITLDVGVIHKIFDQYITGRGYLTFGRQGGFDLTQKYNGQDFMGIKADAHIVLAPGYEVSLGKDIWFSVNSFMRPSIKIGAEYDLLGTGNRDLDFKFSEVGNYRSWSAENDDAWWLRYGVQVDFSFIVGTNISIGYEVLQNGDWKSNQIKLNGTYRF